MLCFTFRNSFIEKYFKHIVYDRSHHLICLFHSFLPSWLKILKSSTFNAGTQKMQLHFAREGPNLQPDIVKYHLVAGYSKWHKNSFNPLWQILGIHKPTLHWLFYTTLFVWTKWCYQWLWMYVYPRMAVMLTSLLCQTLSTTAIGEKCLLHKEFICPYTLTVPGA